MVRAAIVGIILTMMINLHDALYRNTERAALEQNINGPAQVISADLKLAGYGKSTSKIFDVADTSKMIFHADTDNDSTAETIEYYTGPPFTGTNHRVLYRIINNGTPFEIARDVIRFRLRYYDVNGNKFNIPPALSSVSGIKSIYVLLIIESANPMKSLNVGSSESQPLHVTWERHFFPQNL
ncbi:MAG: hypothetical protein PHP42_14235 [Bacteroidota bacterium]|nr:hypothetical protein [Bacteroidota bacterium]